MKPGPKPRPIIDRFWEKVQKTENCWIWKDRPDGDGYGRLNTKDCGSLAHRVAWFVYTGNWPDKLVLHTCDNRLCVKPDHLYLGTDADNVRDRTVRKRHWKDNDPDGFNKHIQNLLIECHHNLAEAIRGGRWINNGIKGRRLKKNEDLPEGWSYGMLKPLRNTRYGNV